MLDHFRDANTGAGQDFTGLTAVVQLRLRVRVRVASIAAMQRSLKPQSTGQHRGDPPSLLEVEPDKLAGTVSKTDRPACGMGSMTSGFRHYF